MRFSTKAIRVGQAPDPTTGSIAVPIYQSVNFIFDDVGRPRGYEYSRSANPTRTALEQCVASLEEAKHGLAFASGMAAVDAVLSLVRPGDHVVSSEHIYGGTFRLFEKVYVPRGIIFTYVDGARSSAFAEAIRENTKLLWIETPANPLLELVDVKAVAAIAAPRGIRLVADNTFASPYFQRPLTQGADIVVQSTTKYISGHSDVIGVHRRHQRLETPRGDEVLSERRRIRARTTRLLAELAGLRTLAIRMRQHEANARAVAAFLAAHSKVAETIYPGLPSHPQHELAKAQMDGFRAIVTFRLPGGNDQVRPFVKALKVFLFAESLGGVESLACHPATMSHAGLTPAERQKIGITDGTIRLSVGIEDIEDLIEDLDGALKPC